MKKILITAFLLTSIALFSEAQEYVTGTIKNGTQPNSVMIAVKSNTTFTGNFSNVQFMVQIPNTVSPQPTASVLTNSLSSNITSAYSTQVTNESGFYNYLFSAVVVGSPSFTFNAGTEYNVLEVQFTNGPDGFLSEVRLGHLADGGSTTQLAFYIEMGGNDFTDYTDMFYGSGASNGGNFSAYSYVPINGIALPLNLTKFTANKVNDDAILNWTIENQSSLSNSFDIERSLDGISFVKIANVLVNPNNNLQADYQYIDSKVSSIRNNGIIYYRLKLNENNSHYTYSAIKNIKIPKTVLPVSIYPNPTKNKTNLSFELDIAKKVCIYITDMNGSKLEKINYNGLKGLNNVSLDLSKYAKGIYTVVFEDESNNQILKAIKL